MKSCQSIHTNASSRRYAEALLLQDAFRRLRRLNQVIVCRDVPLLGRCVDLVFIQDGALVTVEFKMRDWRRAIKQARDHQLGSDYAYICMPKRKAASPMLELLAETGVGLFFYSATGRWPFEIAVSARKSADTWAQARQNTTTYVLSRSRCTNGRR